MVRILPIETLKMYGGLTFGTKTPDGAAVSQLTVPAQDVLLGRLLSRLRARVASRWALVMLVFSPSTTPKLAVAPLASRLPLTTTLPLTAPPNLTPRLSLLITATPSCCRCSLIRASCSSRVKFSSVYGQPLASLQASYLVALFFSSSVCLWEHLAARSFLVPLWFYR